jgi:hypothetical protein
MTISTTALLAACDASFPPTGILGYLTLLGGHLTTGLAYTVNLATNELTTAAAHEFVTGSRIRLVGGTLPSPLLANTDYYVTVVSTTVLTLSATLDGAVIDLTDAGSGALTLTEQPPTTTDPLSVLVNKEVSHPAWTTRAVIEDLGSASAVAGVAQKPTFEMTISNSETAPLTYQHYLIILSTSADTLGSAPSDAGFILSTEASVQNIAAGDPRRAVFFKLRARNA